MILFLDPMVMMNHFAQMSIELKNKISHRGLAVYKLVSFLNQEKLGL